MMRAIRCGVPMVALLVLVSSVSSRADEEDPCPEEPDPNAQTIRLRTDCGSDADCFSNLTCLNEWIDDTRTPGATNPLLVDVGLGEFEGQFLCSLGGVFPETSFSGYVTFRGQSRSASVLKYTPAGGVSSPVISSGCHDLSFENLTLRAKRYGVVWANGGTSTWTNVDIEVGPDAYAFGWYESAFPGYICDLSQGPATHYWYGSNILVKSGSDVETDSKTAVGYNASCGDTWFYGGEITVKGVSPAEGGPGIANRHQAAVVVGATGEFQAFGSLLRSISGPIAANASAGFNPTLGAAGLAAVVVGYDFVSLGSVASAPGGHFHLHGGNATADASAAGGNSTSLLVLQGGVAHTPGASFVSRPGSGGTAQRLRNAGGTAISPFLWQASKDRPSGHHDATGVLQSEDGHDLFVETDCNADGDCDEGGNEAHLMVINPAKCGTTDPWFDVVTGRCRNTEP